jgi:site-specific DNA-adenine methylase
MNYLGAKSQAGVWQRIINQMPPHDYYIEPFFGSGQIFFRKRPAVRNVIIDADADVIARFNADRQLASPDSPLRTANAICGDAVRELAALKPTLPAATVIYCDPPYLHSTRTSRHRYHHEMSDEQHMAFLALVQELPGHILISGYPSKLYADKLRDWRCISYRVRTRGQTKTECLWCNFPEPEELHDWRFIGNGYRERLTLKRFAARFSARLDAMPPLKRNFILHLVHHRHEWR